MHDVAQWRNADPDPETVAELADATTLGAPLRFGTAGLRGPLGAGPDKMNRLVVRRATAGLMATLPQGASVIIGYDARHGSAAFAADAAAVVESRGGRPVLFDQMVPTPVVAHATRARGADAGIMVTASHNPPGDNGYKVYLAGGAQVLPVDAGRIETAIAAVPLVPEELVAPEPVDTQPFVDAYLDDIVDGPELETAPVIVYTPLHGVGTEVLLAAFARRGVHPHVVAAQREPDPDFPTVAFPNPEEPGALDLALADAAELGAGVVLANDPDADRLAVAVVDDGTWRVLSGDQLGALFADWLTTAGSTVATTIVSSSLLTKLAQARGATCRETLTGFKWLMDTDEPLAFAYEEALGYAVNPAVRDKDGISAALGILDMVVAGPSLLERLESVFAVHGLHLTSQVSVRIEGDDAQSALGTLMGRLRSTPPVSLAGLDLVDLVDYASGSDLPPSNVLRFQYDGARVIIRPSGTEPKLKAYLEVVGDSADEASLHARMAALREAVESLLSDSA